MAKFSEIKPLIKEAVRDVVRDEMRDVLRNEMKTIIKESLFSQGALSDLIAESVKGVVKADKGSKNRSKPLQESNHSQTQEPSQNGADSAMQRMRQNFQALMDDDVTNGVDVTEGTAPIDQPGAPQNVEMPQGSPAPQQPSMGGHNDLAHLEQQAEMMRQQHQAQMSPQQARMQAQQQVHESNYGPRDQMSTNDLRDKLKEAEPSSAMKNATQGN